MLLGAQSKTIFALPHFIDIELLVLKHAGGVLQ